MGTKRSSVNLAVRTELIREPLEKYIILQTLKYLGRLHFEIWNPLLKDAFELSTILDSEGVYTWYTYAKTLSLDINIDLKNI